MSEPVCTIFNVMCPFRKDGSPVIGSVGSTVRGVIIIEITEWKKLLEAVPELKTQKFKVGELQ